MKGVDMSRKRATATLAVATIATVLAAVTAIAPDGSASSNDAHGNKLAGTWIVKIARPAPLPPITAHQIYTKNGSFTSFGSDLSGAGRSPEMGSWERVEGRLYASSGASFRFDPQTGALLGSTRINRTLRLSQDGQTFQVVGRVSIIDLGGNVVASFLVTASGERMQVERIADVP